MLNLGGGLQCTIQSGHNTYCSSREGKSTDLKGLDTWRRRDLAPVERKHFRNEGRTENLPLPMLQYTSFNFQPLFYIEAST